ncbi:MAG: Qat anti-phage system TatD family nuclease QatD [Gemmatimonadota bacterium]
MPSTVPRHRASVSALVDTHCHVDLYPDPSALVTAIERQRVFTIAVTNTPSVFARLCQIVGAARYVRPALGLHPELAAERHRELTLFDALLPQTRYVGEVGLDYQTMVEAERSTQRRVLATIIERCDNAGGKVVTVHSRRAADDVVDAFGPQFRGTYILHWYSGSVRALRRALNHGAYISVNPAMARSERGRSLIGEVPRERVLTETDGPFVTVHTGPAVPADVRGVISELGRLWGTDPDEAAEMVYRNFSSLANVPV